MKTFNIFLGLSIFFLSGCANSMNYKSGDNKIINFKEIGIDTVYFDCDDSTLSEDSMDQLNKQITWLKGYPKVKTDLEGHCDERGSEEYNIALGERRAESVKHYMVMNGIDSHTLNVVSYGKSKPIAIGHDEDSWQRNRRVRTFVGSLSE